MTHPFKLGDLVVYAEHFDNDHGPGFYDHVYVDSGIPTRSLLRVLETLSSTVMGAGGYFVKVGCVPGDTPLKRGPKHADTPFREEWWPVSLFRPAREVVPDLPNRNCFDLRPCPFCGSLDLVLAKRNPHNDNVVVWCRGCCAVEVGVGTPVAQHAVDAWNRRI